MRSQKSGSHEPVASISFELATFGPLAAVRNSRCSDCLLSVVDALAATCGNSPARASAARSRACTYSSAKVARFGLLATACASSRSSSGSPNARHQGPRGSASAGRASANGPEPW